MGKLYFFNPDNDLALAAGNGERYTPPAAALDLRRAGALLPLWWCGDGDEVLVETDEAIEAADSLKSAFGLSGTAVRKCEGAGRALPWGWSPLSARLMRDAGGAGVPTPDEIERLRMLSHRRTSMPLARAMGADERIVARECLSEAEAEAAIAAAGGDAVIKQPWSSSGRGVMATRSMRADALRRAIAGTIRRQGSIMVESRLEREADFAALFVSDGRRVRFEGASVFATLPSGAYAGNIVDSGDRLRELIPVDISAAIAGAEKYLTEAVAPYYRGYMGIDMLAYREGGRLMLDPCVELNLRMTMGVAAMLLARRGLRGVLRVKPSGPSADEINLSPIRGARFSVVVSDGEAPA